MVIEASGAESDWVTAKEANQGVSVDQEKSVSADETMMENIEGAVRMEGRSWRSE